MKPEQFKKKGWSKDEIQKAQSLLEKARYHDLFFSKIVFWSALLVIVFGNMVLSLILIPFLVIFKPWMLNTLVVIVAFMMGSVYSFLITDIGYLETKHHLLAGIIIPVIAIINFIVIVIVSNSFLKGDTVKIPLNQWLVSLIFAVAFILPFLVHRLWKIVKSD